MIAERCPLVVVASVAADIDHGVDRGRAAEALAARLIADAPLQARLRHRVERPVVDSACEHKHQRARRGHHPIVASAAGIQQRHRCLRVFRKTPRHSAAAGAATHHDEIEYIGHARFPLLLSFPGCHHGGSRLLVEPRLGHRETSGKRARFEGFWHDPAVIKPEKTLPRPFPKQVCVGTYRPHPLRLWPGVAFSGSL